MLGPLTVRDILLLVGALFALVGMVAPVYRFDAPFGDGGANLWVWNWAGGSLAWALMGMLTVVAAGVISLLNKLIAGFPQRIGSLSPDQLIAVLTTVGFATNFLFLITAVPSFHVGGYFAFFGSLIACFAGVFTMIPFLGAEFAQRDEVTAHPKARPVKRMSKQAQTMQPAPFGSAPQGYGPGPQAFGGAPQAHGSGPQAFGSAPHGYGSAPQGYGSGPQASRAAQADGTAQGYGTAPQGYGSDMQGYGSAPQGYGSGPHDFGSAPQSYEPAPQEPQQTSTDDRTYLGTRSVDSPEFAQSEPTQAFMAGSFGRNDAGVESSAAPETPDVNSPASESEARDPEPQESAAAGTAVSQLADQTLPAARADESADATGLAVSRSADSAENADAGGSTTSVTGSSESDSSTPAPADHDGEAGLGDTMRFDPMWGDDVPSSDSAARTDTGSELQAGGSTRADISNEDGTAVIPAIGREDGTAVMPAIGSGENAFQGDHPQSAQAAGDPDEPTQWFRAFDHSGRESGEAEGQVGQQAQPPIQQAFWFAVPEPRDAVDPSTGAAAFTITPGEWFLALADHGTSFTVRNSDGREGVLHNVEGIQRG